MRTSIRTGLVGLLAAGLVPQAGAYAQAPTAKAAPAATAVAPPSATAKLDEAVATVNGETITRGELINFLNRFQVPPTSPEQVYRDAVDSLINTRLIAQFLKRQQLPPEKINESIAQLERDLRSKGHRDLQSALLEYGQTMDDVRNEYSWVEFVKLKGTDAELKRFATSHKDLIDGTQIQARHIFLSVPTDATSEDKEKLRRKLLAIKKGIEDKTIRFAEAANKYSEDPANAEGSGGDIGYFGLNSGIVEEFAKAAFALKPGEVSDPVETIHGLHLIEVTDRKEGKPIDFEAQKQAILQAYAAELKKQILAAERKDAEEKHAIEIKPMPTDLFAPTPPAATTPSPPPVPASGGNPPAKGASTR